MPLNFRPILLSNSSKIWPVHSAVLLTPPLNPKIFLWKVVDISFFLDETPAIGVDTAKINESEKKNVQMHIQDHDHGDHGVGWCAKIVFFTLMAILAGLVVLIVLENRGGSDREFI